MKISHALLCLRCLTIEIFHFLEYLPFWLSIFDLLPLSNFFYSSSVSMIFELSVGRGLPESSSSDSIEKSGSNYFILSECCLTKLFDSVFYLVWSPMIYNTLSRVVF